MGLFTRSVPALPPTIFGYQPPVGATAGGWRCSNWGCSATEHQADVRRWPAHCPYCDSTIGSDHLDEPWAHAAKRVELDARLRRPRDEQDGEAARFEDLEWRFAEAVLSGDVETARAARLDLDRQLRVRSAQSPYFVEGSTRWRLVTDALAAGWIDEAAGELLDWFDAAVTEDVEDDSARQTNCRQLVDRAVAFLESPRGRSHGRGDDVYDALARLVYEIQEVVTGEGAAGFARVSVERMPYGDVTRPAAEGAGAVGAVGEAISRSQPGLSEDLELLVAFGRYRLLGWEAAGEPGPITDWFDRLARWHRPLLSGTAACGQAIGQLNVLASAHGGWVAIGAWKVLLELCPRHDAATLGRAALAACVRAYDDFGVTNLAIHIPPVEMAAFRQVVGHGPPMDGFWGPPAFATPAGPQKASFLAAAARAAARRHPARLPCSPGVEPVGLEKFDRACLWDFARLVLLGPLLVPVELRHEGAILATVIDAARATDHELVLQHLRSRVAADSEPAWYAVGAARFCEEYLDRRLTGTGGHLEVLDAGLAFLERQELLETSVSPACLSEAEAARLAHRGGGTGGPPPPQAPQDKV